MRQPSPRIRVHVSVPDISRAEEVIPSRSGDVLWVSSRGSNSVKRIDLVIDVRTREMVKSWQYPGTGRPHGIWYSRKAARF